MTQAASPPASSSLLTLSQVAEQLQISPRSVARLIRRAADGDPAGLPHLYAGPRRPRVSPDALRAWIASRTIGA